MRYQNLFRRLACLVTLLAPLVVDGGSFSLNEQSASGLGTGLKWSVANFMDFDFGYAHLFVNQPDAELLDTQGHLLQGSYDASVNIVSASLTFRWGGPREVVPISSKETSGYRR